MRKDGLVPSVRTLNLLGGNTSHIRDEGIQPGKSFLFFLTGYL
jgi:hypothetical protein